MDAFAKRVAVLSSHIGTDGSAGKFLRPALCENVGNLSWWRSVGNPELDLHVCTEGKLKYGVDVQSTKRGEAIRKQIRTEGYVKFEPGGILDEHISSPLHFQRMRKLIDRLLYLNIPPVFCFMFDEFWAVFINISGLVETVLGQGFLRLSDFWAWCVDSSLEQEGWSRHRERVIPNEVSQEDELKSWPFKPKPVPGTFLDGSRSILFDDGMPKSVTIWIPLSNVTTEHSCMHVLPASKDPLYSSWEVSS